MEERNQIEIAEGMTSEEIRAMFFDSTALHEPSYRLYQLNQEGYRYYYRFDEQGEVHYYPSVTTMLGQVMPTSPHLIDWMLANGKEQATEKRDMAAAYGTFMHGCFERLVIERTFDLDGVYGTLLEYMEQNNIPESYFGEWLVKIRKDVLSFAQFLKDFNVRPLAIEIGLYSEFGFAGCVDMPCMMTDKGGEFPAIVDFKSGRKGFWESHEIQLHLYRQMWNENFPEMPIERVFNFSPKDWRKQPTYNLKEQTKAESAKKIPYLLELAKIADEGRDNQLTIISGILNLDSGSIDERYKVLSLAEVLKGKRQEVEDTPEIAENAPIYESSAADKINTQPEEKSPVKTGVSEMTDELDLFNIQF